MVSENSKKNLKPFKKGEDSRRCKKGKQALPDLKELIEELGDDGIKEVVKALYTQAKKGNVKAIQEVFDRYYGKVKQQLDIDAKVETSTDLSELPTDELIKRAEAIKKFKNE